MDEKIIAYGVEIRYSDRNLLTVPITQPNGYMVSEVHDGKVTFGTFHKDLYIRWKAELDREKCSYVSFEPE